MSADPQEALTTRERHERLQVMCVRLSGHYLTQETNAPAKAGNLNAALPETHGDRITVFDVDHVPNRDGKPLRQPAAGKLRCLHRPALALGPGHEIFVMKNPLSKPDLRLPQRLCYLASSIFWLFPFSRLMFLIAPLFYLFFGLEICRVTAAEFAGYKLTYLIASLMIQNMLNGRFRWHLISELYELSETLDHDHVSPLAKPAGGGQTADSGNGCRALALVDGVDGTGHPRLTAGGDLLEHLQLAARLGRTGTGRVVCEHAQHRAGPRAPCRAM